jgi:hypothetical protein
MRETLIPVADGICGWDEPKKGGEEDGAVVEGGSD